MKHAMYAILPLFLAGCSQPGPSAAELAVKIEAAKARVAALQSDLESQESHYDHALSLRLDKIVQDETGHSDWDFTVARSDVEFGKEGATKVYREMWNARNAVTKAAFDSSTVLGKRLDAEMELAGKLRESSRDDLAAAQDELESLYQAARDLP